MSSTMTMWKWTSNYTLMQKILEGLNGSLRKGSPVTIIKEIIKLKAIVCSLENDVVCWMLGSVDFVIFVELDNWIRLDLEIVIRERCSGLDAWKCGFCSFRGISQLDSVGLGECHYRTM